MYMYIYIYIYINVWCYVIDGMHNIKWWHSIYIQKLIYTYIYIYIYIYKFVLLCNCWLIVHQVFVKLIQFAELRRDMTRTRFFPLVLVVFSDNWWDFAVFSDNCGAIIWKYSKNLVNCFFLYNSISMGDWIFCLFFCL